MRDSTKVAPCSINGFLAISDTTEQPLMSPRANGGFATSQKQKMPAGEHRGDKDS